MQGSWARARRFYREPLPGPGPVGSEGAREGEVRALLRGAVAAGEARPPAGPRGG